MCGIVFIAGYTNDDLLCYFMAFEVRYLCDLEKHMCRYTLLSEQGDWQASCRHVVDISLCGEWHLLLVERDNGVSFRDL